MVARSLYVFDSEALTVDASSPTLVPGSPIINNSDSPDGTIYVFDASMTNAIVTLDDTGGDPDIFEDDQSANHVITDGGALVANGTPVEAESLQYLQQLDGFGVPFGPVITVTVFSQNGVTGDVWGWSTDIPLVDGATYVKTGGNNIGSSGYTTFVPCFTPGTMIQALDGVREIESLRVGDRVQTRDNGLCEIRWIGRRHLGANALRARPKLRPIQIDKGALGPTGPNRDLLVSPNHQLLIENYRNALYFGEHEVLAAAKHLQGWRGVRQINVPSVSYIHLMFDQHEVIKSNGMWTESFQPGEYGLEGLGQDQRGEILDLFPALRTRGGLNDWVSARMCLRRREADLLAA